jgi:outer membrane receptor protein involved in Fe transport
LRSFLSVLLVSAAAPALAAEPPIIVTGTGLPDARGDRAYDVVTIGRDRLEQVASGRMEDVLRDVAGFTLFRRSDARSAHPTSMGATLRGLGGNASSRALLLLDGVPQADPFGGWVVWPAYQPMRLGRVRVTRGGGSGAFGPGALAGTIEMSSAGPADVPPLWGGLAYGSRDSIEATAGLSGQLGGGFASISAAYARGDGFIPIVEDQRGAADILAGYEQASVALRFVVPVGAETELQVGGIGFLDDRTRGTAFTDNRTEGADASLRLVGSGKWGWEALAYVQTRAFRSGFASVNADRSAAAATLDQYNVPATGYGARLEVRPPLGDAGELRIGLDGRVTAGRTKELYQFVAAAPTRIRNAGGETRTLGAFVETTLDVTDRLMLTGGGRIDRWWIVDGTLQERQLAGGPSLADLAFADRSGWRPTARAGLAFRPVDAVTLRGAGYLGWRLPTLNELYRPFRAGADATAANAALRPERMRGVEAGADYRPLSTVRLGATLFWNRLDDAIANVSIADGPGAFPGVGFVSAAGVYRMRQNLDAVCSRGVEVEAQAVLAEWQLSASYALTDARVRAGGLAASLDGLRPAQTPRHQASATLGWWRDGAGAALTGRYVAAQFEDDQNSRSLSHAFTVDATARLPLTRDVALELRGENLANENVEATLSGAGVVERASVRTLWVGLRFGG